MKTLNLLFFFLPFVILTSCEPEPGIVTSSFKIYNNSGHFLRLHYFDKYGEIYSSTEIPNDSCYRKEYKFIYCCPTCFLSMSDSVVFLFDDSIKTVHYLYDTTTPNNNIYNSLYFVEQNEPCIFEHFVTINDFLEALENQ